MRIPTSGFALLGMTTLWFSRSFFVFIYLSHLAHGKGKSFPYGNNRKQSHTAQDYLHKIPNINEGLIDKTAKICYFEYAGGGRHP